MKLRLNLLPFRIRRERARETIGSTLVVTGILSWIVGAIGNSHGGWHGWGSVMVWYGVLALPCCIFFTKKVPDYAADRH